jgi:hypothetical protein
MRLIYMQHKFLHYQAFINSMATYVYVYSVAAVIPMATMVLKFCNNDSQACHKSRNVQIYSAGRVSF